MQINTSTENWPSSQTLLYELDKRVELGLIKRQYHRFLPLIIYCYTDLCQYRQAWDEITLFARGLILDKPGNIIAKPFSKFFNLGEPCCPKLPNTSYVAFEKLDGSLCTVFYYAGKWNLATKASFENDYTEFASKYISFAVNYPEYWTLMTEVVLGNDLDQMKRAVNHDPGLFILGATDLNKKEDVHFNDVHVGWRGPKPKTYFNSIEELLKKAETEENSEGWVLRYENGFRVKIKTSWYLRLFKLISNLDKSIKEELLNGVNEEEILSKIPEELQQDAKSLCSKIEDYINIRQLKVISEFNAFYVSNRKEFALSIANSPDKHLFFNLYDKKDIRIPLLKEAVENV